MRKLIAAALAAIALPAAAASEYDGVYMCSYTVPALFQSGQAFFTFHSHPDGTAALLTAATFRPDIHGYSIGTISGGRYSGTDSNGYPVSFALGTTMTIPDKLVVDNTLVYDMSYTCLKIF